MLKIRLRRMGKRNAPFYRVVVSDSRRATTASAVEEIGYYNPRREPSEVVIDRERVDYWTGRGALLSETVAKLVERVPAPTATETAAAPAAETQSAEAEQSG